MDHPKERNKEKHFVIELATALRLMKDSVQASKYDMVTKVNL